MKRIFLLLMLIPFLTNAQITLEHMYPNNFPAVSVVNLSSNGKKFVTHDTASQVVQLHDMQHNLWKTINCPAYTNYKVSYIYAVSDNLFNLDNNIEMVIVYTRIGGGASYKSIIIDENSNVLKDLDSAYQVAIHKDENNNYKLLTHTIKPNGSGMTGYDCSVYSLPGTMPCDQCNALKVGDVNSREKAFISEPVPNPSTGRTTISYILPPSDHTGTLSLYNISGQVILEYLVTDMQSSVTIENGLPAGTYLYNMRTANAETATKKLVIK